jgi:uncharacterized heparinase superfamily protein
MARQIAFARHVPPRQIGRRLWLQARRSLEARLRPSLDPGALTCNPHPPLPLFPPRRGMVERTAGGWRFTYLGRTVEMGPKIDWHPANAAPADQLWRMNLHYMEYLEELSDSNTLALMRDWVAANPPYASGATSDAWNAYSLSLRVVVWMQQLGRRRIRDFALERSLARQLLYLERHIETDIGGNHLIKNIKALSSASAFFEGKAAKRWRRKAIALLRSELGRQILPDGVHFELSPSYHCQVFADLVEIRQALGGDVLGGALNDALVRAARAVADLRHPDGKVAQFSDAGLSMAYAPVDCLAAYGRSVSPRSVFAFPDAGYYGLRHGGAYLIVDAGRIAPDRLPAHGHGDMLSFEWSVSGERLIVDQGVFEYVPGEKRRLSRTARSHNTLTLEGTDQADFFGAFRSARRARIEVIEYRQEGDGFVLEARHDGYARLPHRPMHRRRFEANSRGIRIIDRLEGGGAAGARASLLFSPKADVDLVEPSKARVRCGSAEILITASTRLAFEPAVWWPDMGIEHGTQRLVMDLEPHEREGWMELAHLQTGSDA